MIELIFFGILFFFTAQILRALRWQFLLPPKFNKNSLLFYLSVGSFLNIILPLRIGDIVRSYLLSKNSKIDFGHSLISVFYEKLSDIIFLIIFYFGASELGVFDANISPFLIWIVIFSILLKFSLSYGKFRKIIGYIGIFFPGKFSFYLKSLIWNFFSFGSKNCFNFKFLTITISMWFFYFLSYYYFFLATNLNLFEEAIFIFHGNIFSGFILNEYNLEILQKYNFLLFVFLITPIFFSIFYSLFKLYSENYPAFYNIFHSISSSLNINQLSANTFFPNQKNYQSFLNVFFSVDKNFFQKFSNLSFFSYSILRIFDGGSGALTTLIDIDNKFIVRKVDKIKSSNNLFQQYKWLKKCNFYPVAKVIKYEKFRNDYEYYDMPYNENDINLSDWIQKNNYTKSRDAILEILKVIDKNIKSKNPKKKSHKNFKLFYKNKINKNMKYIEKHFHNFFQNPKIYINNTQFKSEYWNKIKNENYLNKILNFKETKQIHGDLTLENVMKGKKIWYLIDPNPEQQFKSIYLDLGKIFQSLHSKYELLKDIEQFRVYKNKIYVTFPKNVKTDKLFKFVNNFIKKKYGKKALKQVYLHEIFHFIRLMKYKINQNPEKSIIYFARLLLLIKNFKKL